MQTQAENDDQVIEKEQAENQEVHAQEAAQQDSGDQHEAAQDEVLDIGFGDSPSREESTEEAPEWVRELRRKSREQSRIIREKDAELARLKTATTSAKAEVSEKPTLSGCDYDEERYETELDQWKARKSAADAEAARITQEQQDAKTAWETKLISYATAKKELKVEDFEDAEEVVTGTLSVTQQGVLLSGADDPAKLVYALGKSPEKAKQLASITDPVKFAFAAAKLESQLKVTPRKAIPAPERRISGSAPVSGSVDSKLKALEAEAERTGDRTAVVAYKRAQSRT